MFVEAVLAFLAFSVLLIKTTDGYACLVKVVHELALVTFFATIAHPMNADTLFTFLLVDSLGNRAEMCIHVIDGHELVRLLRNHVSTSMRL